SRRSAGSISTARRWLTRPRSGCGAARSCSTPTPDRSSTPTTRIAEADGKDVAQDMKGDIPEAHSSWRAIPRGVWALGFVSMFMDISSEMIHALLPVYLVAVLGTSALTVGVIEGIAEATGQITRIFSGALSDKLGRRKALAVLGYCLSACAKPIFPLASVVGWLMVARFVDRLGKGIRGAPRDALVADLSASHLRGASFGLRQSLDTVGAVLGPLVAIGLMWITGNHFTVVFWIAVVPALVAVALILVAVH